MVPEFRRVSASRGSGRFRTTFLRLAVGTKVKDGPSIQDYWRELVRQAKVAYNDAVTRQIDRGCPPRSGQIVRVISWRFLSE
jgi:hypothetical protein